MMNRLLPYVFGLSLLVGCGLKNEPASEADEEGAEAASRASTQAEIDAVQADVRKLQTALYSGDYKTVVEMTNPDMLSALGADSEEAEAEIAAAMSQLQASELELELLTFPEDPTFLQTAEHDFVIVPTLSAYKLRELRIESQDFLLGVKPRGAAKWTYIDGNQFEQSSVQDTFPDFPLDQALPEVSRRQL